jgi:peptidyl-dipeptidase A
MKLSSVLVAIVTIPLAAGCCKAPTGEPAKSGQEEGIVDQASTFLTRYNQQFQVAEGDAAHTYWKASNTGAKEDFDEYARADLALKMLHSDKDRYAELKTVLAGAGGLAPLTQRSLHVAELAYRGNQLPPALLEKLVKASSEIEQAFKTHRGTFEGEKVGNNTLLEVLAKETDSVRRQAAWEASKEVGDLVARKIVELARLRNEGARTLGFANFWDMQIRLQDHDPAMIMALFKDLEEGTQEAFDAHKASIDEELSRRFGVPVNQLMPWHYDNPFFQQAPSSDALDLDVFFGHYTREDIVRLAVEFFGDIGLPMEDLAAQSDFYEREGKDQHAFCITMDRGADVRMLLNIKPTAEWMDTMLHETGHAVYYKFIDRTLPFNLREAAHIFTTEAVAMLFGALAKDPGWLVDYAAAKPEQVEQLSTALIEQRKREQLIFARWTLVMLHFEKALYENPDQDLNALWWDMVERFQLLKRPEGRNRGDWAAKPHFTIAPVYYHNYMLGEIFAAQLRATLVKKFSPSGEAAPRRLRFKGNPAVGQYLIEKVFKPGMSLPWPEFVATATGEPLTIRYFAEETR